jgi:hypothetical protein
MDQLFMARGLSSPQRQETATIQKSRRLRLHEKGIEKFRVATRASRPRAGEAACGLKS